ncbi:P25-alpha [Aphelenchoides fujianensis]|nr:P25-alpha [Aphelenchoides fujianensis]
MSSNNSSSSLEFKWGDAKEMRKRWEAFAKFGNTTPGSEMTGKNFDKWLKDAGVIGKDITTTMTGIAFSKVAGPKKKVNFPETKQVLANVAQDRASQSKKEVQEELDDIIEKLAKLEAPIVKPAVKPSTEGVYSRLTDTKKYTGSHKERFDESGKGKGKAGRVDVVENTGYVASYKAQGTYDKLHNK